MNNFMASEQKKSFERSAVNTKPYSSDHKERDKKSSSIKKYDIQLINPIKSPRDFMITSSKLSKLKNEEPKAY